MQEPVDVLDGASICLERAGEFLLSPHSSDRSEPEAIAMLLDSIAHSLLSIAQSLNGVIEVRGSHEQ